VTETVTHERHALLHDEDADERCGRAHDDAGNQRELHVRPFEGPR